MAYHNAGLPPAAPRGGAADAPQLAFIFTVWDRMFGTYQDHRALGDGYKLAAIPTEGRLLRMVGGF